MNPSFDIFKVKLILSVIRNYPLNGYFPGVLTQMLGHRLGRDIVDLGTFKIDYTKVSKGCAGKSRQTKDSKRLLNTAKYQTGLKAIQYRQFH